MVAGMNDQVGKTDVTRCRNCDAPLSGEYCSQCGQREGRGDLRFSDLLGELVGDFFAWDSRIWRTLLPLIFRPGFLTAEYMAGRRARYVPPLRLYLILSFALFLLLSVATPIEISGQDATVDGPPGEQVGREEEPAESVVRIGIGSADEEASMPAADDTASDMSGRIDLADEDSPRWLQNIDQRMEDNVSAVQDDPGEYIAELVEYLPQMMFLMLPLFAVLLRICYLFSPYHYLQHLVFSLNYHSFVFLLYLVSFALGKFGTDVGGFLFLVLLAYLPVGLWRAYGSGIAGAIAKSLLIYFSYGILLVVGFAAVSVLVLVLM